MSSKIHRGRKWEKYCPRSRGPEGQQSLLSLPPQKGPPEPPPGRARDLVEGPWEAGTRRLAGLQPSCGGAGVQTPGHLLMGNLTDLGAQSLSAPPRRPQLQDPWPAPTWAQVGGGAQWGHCLALRPPHQRQGLSPRLSPGVGEGRGVRPCVCLALDGEVCTQEPSPETPEHPALGEPSEPPFHPGCLGSPGPVRPRVWMPLFS